MLIHKPGKTHTQANSLTRLAVPEAPSDADDNQQVIALSSEHFCIAAAIAIVEPLPFDNQIRNCTQ